jgi:hypothetical protein
MGTKTVKFSDLSGKEVGEVEQLVRLVVEEHPGFRQLPITLEVLPEDVEGRLPETDRFVSVLYYAPGSRQPQRLIVSVDAFNGLAQRADMDTVLSEALYAEHQARGTQGSSGRRGRGRTTGERGERINYASPEHAGNPHRGRVTEAEREYVRTHLGEVNARLQAQGLRTIDPADSKMQERYGLSADQAA